MLKAEASQENLFENTVVRTTEHKGEIWFSIVDAIRAIKKVKDARQYWKVAKANLTKQEGGFELVKKIYQLKMVAEDGKLRETDCVNEETLYELLFEIPSKKTRKFKQWASSLVKREIREIQDPTLTIERGKQNLKKKSYNPISEYRNSSIDARNGFTDAFFAVGKGKGEIIASTKKITMAIFDMMPNKIKPHINLKDADNLRDNVTGYALSLFQVAENIIALDLISQQKAGRKKISSSEATQKACIWITRLREEYEQSMGKTLLAEEIQISETRISVEKQLSLF